MERSKAKALHDVVAGLVWRRQRRVVVIDIFVVATFTASPVAHALVSADIRTRTSEVIIHLR